MNVEVFLTASSASEDDLKGKSVIVIDVLRACSTIVTALNHGARAILPVADMAEAGKIAAHMDDDLTVMGGERGGVKIDGYDLGNSPAEYTPEVVQGRTIVLNTSNGTRAFTQARGAAEVAAGSFLNVSQAIAFAFGAQNDLALVCAGSDNRVGLEDVLCAGLILHQLWDGQEPPERTDAAHIAFSQYLHDRADLTGALLRSVHAQRLIALGFEEDVRACAQVDAVPVLPVYRDNRLVLADPAAAAVPAKVPVSEPAEE